MQIDININPASWVKLVDGYKTYIGCAVSAAMVIANHFGWLPPQYVPAQMNSANWIGDLTTLYFIAAGRSALSKNSAIGALITALTQIQQAKLDPTSGGLK